MKGNKRTKFDRVFAVVLSVVGNDMTRYQAAEAAQHLLKVSGSDEKKAMKLAKCPLQVRGRLTY